ncbi:hypothetical protein ACFC1D_01985 [Streptomyces vinaceus]|uniref:hypothetical protein n=1 Tax=Streptomyces vinaceus TaxID=1960 RepID=UPI0035DC5B7D
MTGGHTPGTAQLAETASTSPAPLAPLRLPAGVGGEREGAHPSAVGPRVPRAHHRDGVPGEQPRAEPGHGLARGLAELALVQLPRGEQPGGELGAHHRAGGGADDEVGRGQVHARLGEPVQDPRLPADAGQSPAAQHQCRIAAHPGPPLSVRPW